MQKSPPLRTADFLDCVIEKFKDPTAKQALFPASIVDWISAVSFQLASIDFPTPCVGKHRKRARMLRRERIPDQTARSQDHRTQGDAYGYRDKHTEVYACEDRSELSSRLIAELLNPFVFLSASCMQLAQQIGFATAFDLQNSIAIAAGPLVPMPALLDYNFEQRPQTCMCIAIWSVWLNLVMGSIAGGALIMHTLDGGFHGVLARFVVDPTFHHWALLMPLPMVGGSIIQGVQFYILSKDPDGFGSAIAKLFGAAPAPLQLQRRVTQIAAKAEFLEGTPKVYVIPSLEVNAFATGLDASDSVVAVTEGILNSGMTDDELDAVLAHEIGHIRNQDIISSMHLTVMIAGFTFLMSLGMQLWLANMSRIPEAPPEQETEADRQQRERQEKVAKQLPMAMMIAGAIMFVPARLMQRWHSRRREFAADEAALALTGTDAIARALDKIEARAAEAAARAGARPGVVAALGPRFAHTYLTEGESSAKWITHMLATHPPTEDRTAAILKTLSDRTEEVRR